MYPNVRQQTVQMCSLVAQVDYDECGIVVMPLRLATSLMLLGSQDPVDRARLLEALEHLHPL